jgi:hypothetical protein
MRQGDEARRQASGSRTDKSVEEHAAVPTPDARFLC